jgi:hypothetical protein
MKKIQFFAIVAMLFIGVDSFAQPQGYGGQRGGSRGPRQQMTPEAMAKAQADNIAEWISVDDKQKQEIYNMYLATAAEQQKISAEQMKLMQELRKRQQEIQAKQEEQLKAIVGEKKYEKYQKQKQAQMQAMQQRMQQMRQAQQGGGGFGEQGGQRAGGENGGFGGGMGFE